MPRKARINAPVALHHILVRGIERQKIFYDSGDMAERLNLAQPTVSQAVIRGQKIAEDQGLSLIKKPIQ